MDTTIGDTYRLRSGYVTRAVCRTWSRFVDGSLRLTEPRRNETFLYRYIKKIYSYPCVLITCCLQLVLKNKIFVYHKQIFNYFYLYFAENLPTHICTDLTKEPSDYRISTFWTKETSKFNFLIVSTNCIVTFGNHYILNLHQIAIFFSLCLFINCKNVSTWITVYR